MTEYKSSCALSIRALGFRGFHFSKMFPRLWLLGLLACSFVNAEYYNTKTADKDFLLKQKKVYNLLYHVSQPAEINYTWYEEGQKWDIEANINLYSNPVSNYQLKKKISIIDDDCLASYTTVKNMIDAILLVH